MKTGKAITTCAAACPFRGLAPGDFGRVTNRRASCNILQMTSIATRLQREPLG